MQKKKSTAHYRILILVFILAGMIFSLEACSQDDGDPGKEFWPEIDVYLRFSPQWRFSAFFPLTRDLETQYREGSVNYQVDYSWGKPRSERKLQELQSSRTLLLRVNMARVGYYTSRTIVGDSAVVTERASYMEYHRKVALGEKLLMTQRLRSDLRFLGDDAEFSYRIRYRLQLEGSFKSERATWVPFFWAEAGFDSRFEEVNRYRFTTGTEFSHVVWYSIKPSLNYQYDSATAETHLFSFALSLNFFFEL